MTKPSIDDPRLVALQCHSLTPVEKVHRNPWFSVCDRWGYYCVEYDQPQVAVLPIVGQRAVVMIRVKRPTLADVTLELPTGGALDYESPIQAAARKLVECIKFNHGERLQSQGDCRNLVR